MEEADRTYRGVNLNMCWNNCHHHVACALNNFEYLGKTNWTFWSVCWLMVTNGKYVSFCTFLETYAAFLIICTIAILIAVYV